MSLGSDAELPGAGDELAEQLPVPCDCLFEPLPLLLFPFELAHELGVLDGLALAKLLRVESGLIRKVSARKPPALTPVRVSGGLRRLPRRRARAFPLGA